MVLLATRIVAVTLKSDAPWNPEHTGFFGLRALPLGSLRGDRGFGKAFKRHFTTHRDMFAAQR